MSTGPVIVDNIGTISLIGLNRPERRNAVDPPTAEILYRAFKDFEQDKNRTVAILYGNGM
jgi:enoyl-CoA hydratase